MECADADGSISECSFDVVSSAERDEYKDHSKMMKLNPGERQGWWSAKKFDRRIRMMSLERTLVSSPTFAKKLRLRDIPDHGRSIDIQGISEGKVSTTRRVLMKITLGWEMVYEFEMGFMAYSAGVDVVLGTDFMIPSGIRLDLFHGAAQLPNEVCIPLIKTEDMVESMEYSAHVKSGPSEALDVPGHESREYRLAKRAARLEQHVLWVRRTEKVSERTAFVPAFDRLAMLVLVGDLPRGEGYVCLDSKKYKRLASACLRELSRPTAVQARRSPEDALDVSTDRLTCAERWEKILEQRERDGGRLDSEVTDENSFEELQGIAEVMNTATWVQLVSGVGDDASSTMTRETTIVSDGNRPSGDSSASYIATSENEGTTTVPEEIHASLKVLDTVASVRLGPGFKATPAEEAVVTLDEGYISVAHVLTTEDNEILDDTGRDYVKLPRDYRGFVMSFGGSAKTDQYGGRSSCSWILWSLPEWKIVIAANACLLSTTVNLAAYTGMNNGVKAALARGAEDLVVVGDSRLPTPQGERAKEYNAAADTLATETLESKLSRVVLAEARKSELATINRIQEVIYEPREDEGTTKVGPRNFEHCERDLTGSDDCQLGAAGKCTQDDISGDCGDCGNIAEIPRNQASTRVTTEASLSHWEKSVALHGTRKTRSGKETAQSMAWTILHNATSGVHPRQPYTIVDEHRAL
ncbi:hypothetical protein F441_22978 [Phytophthora nicotianae CJ01A1]|uniref:Peptidase A2 domain-containing protein n=1 Tax=Phytophthora nicotianae CJ01A1 TaxID=1317063 RepID=W2VPK9_PHYNI|nr:hypothetical protein F441_22978 [Phytophthora nicotianae CJ01A1]